MFYWPRQSAISIETLAVKDKRLNLHRLLMQYDLAGSAPTMPPPVTGGTHRLRHLVSFGWCRHCLEQTPVPQAIQVGPLVRQERTGSASHRLARLSPRPNKRGGKYRSALTNPNIALITIPTTWKGIDISQRSGHAMSTRIARGQQTKSNSAQRVNVSRTFIFTTARPVLTRGEPSSAPGAPPPETPKSRGMQPEARSETTIRASER